MTSRDTESVVSSAKAYYDGPADQIYRTIWGDDCPYPEAMEHTNEIMAQAVCLTREIRVLDLGCGYGATARYLASRFGCHVIATNISQKELALALERTEDAGLEGLLAFEYGDFHDLKYPDASFDIVWSQEAFLHCADKSRILSECRRILAPGGTLAFTDILVRRGTSASDRDRIYDRVKSPDMWDLADYRQALEGLGFDVGRMEDWSEHVARSYGWVRGQVLHNRSSLLELVDAGTVDGTVDALGFWVEAAQGGKIGWALFVAQKPFADV
jgi:sarcosine/dimethylglycine N-methyltransferase